MPDYREFGGFGKSGLRCPFRRAKKIPEAANPRGAEDSSCFRGRLDHPVCRLLPILIGFIRRTVMVRTIFGSRVQVKMAWRIADGKRQRVNP
jgi:hypothetical protein